MIEFWLCGNFLPCLLYLWMNSAIPGAICCPTCHTHHTYTPPPSPLDGRTVIWHLPHTPHHLPLPALPTTHYGTTTNSFSLVPHPAILRTHRAYTGGNVLPPAPTYCGMHCCCRCSACCNTASYHYHPHHTHHHPTLPVGGFPVITVGWVLTTPFSVPIQVLILDHCSVADDTRRWRCSTGLIQAPFPHPTPTHTTCSPTHTRQPPSCLYFSWDRCA